MVRVIAYLYSNPLLETSPGAEFWGWEIDRCYQDMGTSAAAPRPALQQLLQEAEATPPNYLLIRQLDDLGASLATVSQHLARLEALGTTVIAVDQGYCSTDVAAETAIPSLLQILSRLPERQRSRQIRQGHARNRIKGLPPPGKAPYGYRRGRDRYLLDRSTVPVVKAFFEQFILFGSLRGAVRYLEKRYGKKISVSTGRRWLENPVYRGDTAYRDGQVVLDTHVPVISREEAAQVDRLLRRNRQLPPRTATAPRSLAGLVTCQRCGDRFQVAQVSNARKSQTYVYLRNQNCPQQQKCKAIAYDAVLQATITEICDRLPAAVDNLDTTALTQAKADLTAALKQKQQVLEQIPTLVVKGVLEGETAVLRRYQLRTEMAELQQRLAQLPPVNLKEIAQAVAIPRFWQDLSEAERRFFFREFIQEAELIRTDQNAWKLALTFIF
jgi:DNA invertase Pin-like site-specific DNA recombinase